MWQSRVEIEGYSFTYFDRIAAFEALYRWTPVKGGAHIHYIGLLDIHASMKRIDTHRSWEVQQYSASKAAMQSKYATE